MKKVIVEQVQEEAQYFCDKHPKRECFTHLKTQCWYGSKFDTLNIEIHLCDECMEAFYKYAKKNFGVEPIESII